MRRLSILAALLATLASGAVLPPPAVAAQAQVVADCNSHARLTRQYSVSQLRNALSTLPADVKEYTNCYDVIQLALLAQLGGSHQGGSGGPSHSSGGSFLPTPLIVVLVALVLSSAGLLAVAIRRRAAGERPD